MMLKRTYIYLITGLVPLAVVATGCSLNNVSEPGNRVNSKEDLLAARHILAGSVSSDEGGIILSLNDALTLISKNVFTASNYSGGRSGRGNETGYTHTYHETNGMHIVTFKRVVQEALFSKTVSDKLHYRYRTPGGTNIKFPQQNSGRIASIYYHGRREGKIKTLHERSHFVRRDTFLIAGLNTPVVNINGVHHGSGTITVTPKNGNSFKRRYELEINLLNITASSEVLNNNRDFWKKVSGTLSWQLQISHSGSSTKMGGTIKLSGAGMAALNIRGYASTYQVNLNNGDLKDEDNEFEGRVTAVDVASRRITLFNGRKIYLPPNTDIEQDETYPSLNAVTKALANGINVWTEGEGSIQNGQFVVTEIEFEKEDDDQDENKTEFDDRVSSVDAAGNIFTLFGKVTVAINRKTDIDDDGDFQNLKEVAAALANGLNVSAEGEATAADKTGIADLVAVEVEFKRAETQHEDEED